MTSIRLALMALALGACAKQVPVAAPVPATAPASKTLDIYHLCDDARFESMCSPASTERGMQVDTNLESTGLRTTLPA
jgi:hypothetical protein